MDTGVDDVLPPGLAVMNIQGLEETYQILSTINLGISINH